MSKVRYLQRVIAAQTQADRFRCPNCNAPGGKIVDRKYLITQLRRCPDCALLYRTPTDQAEHNAGYYENEYREGFTTEIPDDGKLDRLVRGNFVGAGRDYSHYIEVIRQLGIGPGCSIFDYGCSWGYGSYQFRRSGMEVTSFEVAPSRRNFAARKLGIPLVENMEDAADRLGGQYDCFFSAHVLEHVPAPSLVFRHAWRLLKTNGLFVSFTPNGCEAHRQASRDWSRLWGEPHPNFIDEVFLDKSFHRSPRAIGSSPVYHASLPVRPELTRLNSLDGRELFFSARKIAGAWN